MRIHKVLIIDDKPLIRSSLVQTIDWNKLNCTVSGQCDNGVHAIELIESFTPDIVITDIKMPGMDGLSLTSYLKEHFPNTKVIIITGYQEFDYAKKALQLGVLDIILKPIQNSLLEQLIAKAVQQINEEQSKLAFHQQLLLDNDNYKNQIDLSLTTLQNQFILGLLKNRTIESDLDEEQIKHMKLDHIKFCVIISRVRSSDLQQIINISNRQCELLLTYEKSFQLQIFDMTLNQDSIYLMVYKRSISSQQNKKNINEIFSTINHLLDQEYHEICCLAVSQMSDHISNVYSCYEQAQKVLDSCYFTSTDPILFSNNYNLMSSKDNSYIIKDLDHFYQILEHLPIEDIEDEMIHIVAKIAASSKGSDFTIKCLLGEICITIIRHYSDKLYNQTQYENSINEVMTDIDKLMDIKQAQTYLIQFVNRIKSAIQEKQATSNPIISQALTYIHDNYNKDISLTMLSAHLHLNPSYLSRLLKKETGKNFVDLLAEIRISIAKQYLSQPGSKILDVCQSVGYHDYAYFYQVFKRLEHISPSDYKKRGKKI